MLPDSPYHLLFLSSLLSLLSWEALSDPPALLSPSPTPTQRALPEQLISAPTEQPAPHHSGLLGLVISLAVITALILYRSAPVVSTTPEETSEEITPQVPLYGLFLAF